MLYRPGSNVIVKNNSKTMKKNTLVPLSEEPMSPGFYQPSLVDEGYVYDALRDQKFTFRPDLHGKVRREQGPIIELVENEQNKLYIVVNPTKKIQDEWGNLLT